MSATAPRGHQRTGELHAHRAGELQEGPEAGGAVDVQGVEDDASGQAEVGVRPAGPPAADAVGVGAGLLDAVADQGMLGRPITHRAAGQEQARLASPEVGRGQWTG
jgi:hypothetical protein